MKRERRTKREREKENITNSYKIIYVCTYIFTPIHFEALTLVVLPTR